LCMLASYSCIAAAGAAAAAAACRPVASLVFAGIPQLEQAFKHAMQLQPASIHAYTHCSLQPVCSSIAPACCCHCCCGRCRCCCWLQARGLSGKMLPGQGRGPLAYAGILPATSCKHAIQLQPASIQVDTCPPHPDCSSTFLPAAAAVAAAVHTVRFTMLPAGQWLPWQDAARAGQGSTGICWHLASTIMQACNTAAACKHTGRHMPSSP
jgi:hypothetical protein